jgi:hydrogenase maturation protease
MTVVVIGVGNTHRRDDGVGPAVAAKIAADCPAGVRVVTCVVEPTAILDAWDGADLAVVIDAAAGEGVVAGRVRRCEIGDLGHRGGFSSHDLDLAQTYELARVLGRAPSRVVVVSVEVADVGYGVGLSCQAAQAVPRMAAMVLDELCANSDVPKRL